MAPSKTWFIEQRAEDLAIVLLTRFPVTVTLEADIGRGPDLRVVIDPDKPGFREFAVEVRGTTRLHDVVDEHDCVRPEVLRASQRMHRNAESFEGKMAETLSSTTVSTKLWRIDKLPLEAPQAALPTPA